MRWISGFHRREQPPILHISALERDGVLSVRRLVLGLSPRFASTGDEDDRTKAPAPTSRGRFFVQRTNEGSPARWRLKGSAARAADPIAG
jgi:hypothetical protein